MNDAGALNIQPGRPIWEACLHREDAIVSVNRWEVATIGELRKAVSRERGGWS